MSSVKEAAAGGDRRELLVAMRDRVAEAITDEKTPPRDLAALTLRLMGISKEIEGIDAQEEQEVGQHAEVGDGEFDPEAI